MAGGGKWGGLSGCLRLVGGGMYGSGVCRVIWKGRECMGEGDGG